MSEASSVSSTNPSPLNSEANKPLVGQDVEDSSRAKIDVEKPSPEGAGKDPHSKAVDGEWSRLHVSCKEFGKVPLDKVKRFIEKSLPPAMQIKDVFKTKQWGFVFVTVRTEDAAAFREALSSSEWRRSPVVVNTSTPRDPEKTRPRDADADEPQSKKRKTKDFPEGYAPTLKDIKDKERSHKGAGIDKSVKQKSAPLHEYPYPTQLAMKSTYVKSSIRAFTKGAKAKSEADGSIVEWTDPTWTRRVLAPANCGCPLDQIIATPDEHTTGYRNKCEFTIGHDACGEIEVGFVLKTTIDMHQVIDTADQIPHVPDVMKRLCKIVREHVRSSSFPVFDRRREAKTGTWRTVMCRLSGNGNMLVCLQTGSVPDDKREDLSKPFVEALLAADLNVTSVYMQFNDGVSDAALPDSPLTLVHGDERQVMPLMGLKFEIGPLSFFQTNAVTAELLYSRALEWLCPNDKALVLDVCCGVGTIGLCVANRCRKLIGIELVPEAVESARQNAALNGISNAEFHAGKAEDVLPAILSDEVNAMGDDTEVCAVVDPPRPGLHKDVLQALRGCKQLSRIVYISCNPDSLAEDVVRLTVVRDGEDPFIPVRAVAVDMFPHTLHVEMVLVLERRSRVPDPPSVEETRAQRVAALAGSTNVV